MLLSCGTAYELMQCVLSYIFCHFIAHLLLGHTANVHVMSWLSVKPSYFIHYCDFLMGAMAFSNHHPHDSLLNRLFRHRSKKT